jgi:hypothetical protein
MKLNEYIELSHHQSINDWFNTNVVFWDEHRDQLNAKLENFSGGMREHSWEDGVDLFVYRNHRLPGAAELAEDMFDEWDDPVSTDQAQVYLDVLNEVCS